jgi:multiple sugar transport system substrate-binding protein
MLKKLNILLAIFMMAAMILSACAPKATPEPTQPPVEQPQKTEAPAATQEQAAPADPLANIDPSGQTVLFWHNHTLDREKVLQQIVNDFNNTNEWGIQVMEEYQGSYNDIFNKMLAVLNTPDAPQLVVAYQNNAATYQLGDGLVDMNPMVNSPKWGLSEADQKDFFPGFWSQDVFPTYGNARLGFPPNRSMEVLYYNEDWLKELGYDGPPTTPDEFKEMACKAVQQPFSKATVEGSMGYELSIDASRFASWTFAFGGDIFDYNTSKFTYDSEAADQAMTFLQELFDSGCATIVTESYGDQTDFGTGKLLFSVGSSSGLPFYNTAVSEGAGFNWSVAAIPHTTPEPVMNIYGASVSIPKTTPEGELAAWLFVKYYTSPEIQAKWAMASQYFPVRESVAKDLESYFAENPAYKTAFDMLKYGTFEPPVPGYDFVRLKVGDTMAAIADGADVASSLASLNEEANTILSEQMTSPLPTPVPTPTPEPTPEPIGTADHPIKVLFVPSVDVDYMIESGALIEQGLKDATGLEFKVSVPTSYAATIEEMCASPTDTIGFIPAMGYALANQLCGVEPGLASQRYGWNVYWTQFIVQRDSKYQTLGDLEGATWGYPEVTSTSGYLYPKSLFDDMGITPGKQVETGGHPETVKAVYNGEVDFGTSYFSAPLLPEGTWSPDMPPDVPDDVVADCAPNEEGQLWCDGYRVLDARSAITEEAPDVVQKVRILGLTPEIPNDTMSFSPQFPTDLKQKIMDAVIAFIGTDACAQSLCNEKFYNWTGAAPIYDENFDGIRIMMEAQGITLENIGK